MINISYTSKPFIVFSIFFLLLGSVIGSLWMMNNYGFHILNNDSKIFSFHRLLIIDGFLTLIIIGVGFMIIPRFRNISNPSLRIGYIILGLITSSILLSIFLPNFFTNISIRVFGIQLNFSVILIPKLIGVLIFVIRIIVMLKIKPKLLVLSDYFILISVSILVVQNIIDFLSLNKESYSITYFQIWFLFPIVMIFGIEYKTMPSFLGYIRPQKIPAIISILMLVICATSGFLYLSGINQSYLLYLFQLTFLFSTITFILSNFIFGGFDFGKIIQYTKNENRVRYRYIQLHTRISFLYLLSGLVMTICYHVFVNSKLVFLFYDSSIHFITIGFIGVTILLYLPLMLPPIMGKMIRISRLNFVPLYLLIISLGLRVIGDIFISMRFNFFQHDIQNNAFFWIFGLSGWLIVLSIISFLLITKRSISDSRL